jgi:hypothetical protein
MIDICSTGELFRLKGGFITKITSCDTAVLSPELEKHGRIFLVFLILVVKHTDLI